MDLMNQMLNVVAPPILLITLLMFLPPLIFLRLILRIVKSIFSEDMEEKVVLITGASSGIGEHIAYEYAMRGACLALVARRERQLQQVAETAQYLGSPEVIVIPADVTNVEDSKHFIDETINHFGRLDHLVNNAGIATMSMFEDFKDITNAAPVMETNFWGSVYGTHFALPHLRNSRGKIIVTASAGAWLPAPRLALYSVNQSDLLVFHSSSCLCTSLRSHLAALQASKAAVIMFFETLRVELQGEVGITIVTPGVIESELTKGKFLSKEGRLELDQQMRDVSVSLVPVEPVTRCAKAIVDSACRGDRSLTVPSWMNMSFIWKVFFPEAIEWCNRMLLITKPGTPETEAPSKKILDFTGAKPILYPSSIQ